MNAPINPGTWHAGEIDAQTRAGTAGHMAEVGPKVIRDFMPDQHRLFFQQLPFIVVGSLDAEQRPWASVLAGLPGFITSPHSKRLEVEANPVPGDPLAEALQVGNPLGILGIELPTRRRNRMNGHIVARDEAGFAVHVRESFGNCPQYIQRRDYTLFAPEAGAVRPFAELPKGAIDLIRRTDTMFVASAAEREDGKFGVDVSHRGGQPGFLGLDGEGAIVVPDFRGNGFFQTIGNLIAFPRAGLLIPDFATGDLLQVTGAAEVVWDGPEVHAYSGAEQLWKVKVRSGRWLRAGLPLRFGPAELSPRSLAMGVYPQA
jgi:predicted pyridoxine 5'-phosphate oxidase superfamily flavin-nucleotide-binding protein